MLGVYEDFPETIHCAISFIYKTSQAKIQNAILDTFYTLNQRIHELNEIITHSLNCNVSFECGIAETLNFTYIDKEELNKFKKMITKKTTFATLDFLCITKYHKKTEKERKKKPLKFDYYILRFLFHGKTMLILAYHERGPQHIPPGDLLKFIAQKIAKELHRKT